MIDSASQNISDMRRDPIAAKPVHFGRGRGSINIRLYISMYHRSKIADPIVPYTRIASHRINLCYVCSLAHPIGSSLFRFAFLRLFTHTRQHTLDTVSR